MSNSGTLLKSFYRTGSRLFRQGLTQPSPASSSAFCRRPGLLRVLHPGRSSLCRRFIDIVNGTWRESEIQSRGLSQPSYSGPNARSLEASDHGADSAGQVNDGGDRRPCVLTEERDRGFQAGRAWTETEANRKENPPAKIKLRHRPGQGKDETKHPPLPPSLG